MTLSELIRSMAAAGATPEAIAIAVEAIEARDAQIEARRAADRDRKRRQRAGLSADNHGTVTGQSRDIPETVTGLSGTPSPLKERSPTPPKENNPPPSQTSLRSVCEPRARDEVFRILAEAVSDQTANEIIAHRKALKSTLTPGAARGLVKAWREFGDPEAAATAQMANGWKGFNSDWMRGHSPYQTARAGPAGQAPPPQKRDPYLAAREQILGEIYGQPNDEIVRRPADDGAEIVSIDFIRANGAG